MKKVVKLLLLLGSWLSCDVRWRGALPKALAAIFSVVITAFGAPPLISRGFFLPVRLPPPFMASERMLSPSYLSIP